MSGSEASDYRGSMRVLTWNVLWRFGGNWREREPAILSTLEAYRPDVLGLVETWAGDGTSQPDRLAAVLSREGHPLHAAFARTSLPPEPDPIEYPDQAGIVVGIGLVSRWPILGTKVHELPHDQREGAPPTALLATLDHPRGPLHVIVTCLEWEAWFTDDTLAQAHAVAALAADPRLDGPLPVLVMGDMNAVVDQPELAPLVESMVDTWTAGGGDPAAVTLDSAVPMAPLAATKVMDRRIDHIFARPGRPDRPVAVHGAFLAGDRPINGVYPSDHYAVGADLAP
jgi:endonuclease/exonuclease/phosphatase family metal-dependent hydrolase